MLRKEATELSLEGKKIAILVEADFEDDELTSPLQVMKEAGAKVTVVGSKAGMKYRGKRHKAEIVSDAALMESIRRILMPSLCPAAMPLIRCVFTSP
jgi:putative intracellular protease/amidase